MNRLFKYTALAILLAACYNASCQDDFHKLYRKVDNMTRRLDVQVPMPGDLQIKDSLKIFALEKRRLMFYNDSIAPLLKQANNLSFPDIYFTDAANKNWSVSDFDGTDIVINYNYLYCMSCIKRIDSTLKRIRSRKVKMIVLVSDRYIHELPDLDTFKDEVLVGCINADNLDLISMKQGDDCMYYLNSNRQIEFFDKSAGVHNHREAWLTFLDNHFK